MSQDDLDRILAESGTIIKGHFVLNSHLHTETYVNKWELYKDPYRYLDPFCRDIMEHFTDYEPIFSQIDWIVGPAVGGIPMCTLLQYIMAEQTELIGMQTGMKYKDIFAAYAVKDFVNDELKIQKSYHEDIRDKNVLVVDDVVSSGLSIKAVINEVRALGGKVLAAACLFNRAAQTTRSLGVPTFYSCLDELIVDWEESSCPLCAKQVPIDTNVGHGAEFLKKKEIGKEASKIPQPDSKPFDISIF